jgi:hypothetical protein
MHIEHKRIERNQSFNSVKLGIREAWDLTVSNWV